MVRDVEQARAVHEPLLRAYKALFEAADVAREKLDDLEFISLRDSIGRIAGEMVFELLNPLYRAHPELKPKDFE